MNDALTMYWPIVVMLFLGYVVVATRYLPLSVGESLMQYMMKLPLPVVVFHGVTRIQFDQVSQAMPFLLSYTAVQILFFLGSYALFCLGKFSHNASVSLSTTIFVPNLAFFSLPVILQLPDADMYLHLFVMGLFITSVLLSLVVVPMFRFDAAEPSGENILWQCLIETLSTPMVVGLLLGVAVVLSGFTLPQAVDEFLFKFSDILSTSGLIALGMGMRFNFLKKNDLAMWAAVLAKSVLMPLVAIGISRFAGLNQSHQLILVLMSACPTGGVATIVATRFSNIRDQVLDVFVGSTMLSILIYGFWVHIARMQLAI